MSLKSLALGGLLALGTVLPALGQETVDAKNVDAILEIVRGYDSSAELGTQGNGDPKIMATTADGINYQVYFRNCTDNGDCEDIQFYAGFGFDADSKPAYETINEWNYTKRFGRAYLDGDQDPCLEMDLDLVVGVAPDYIDSTVALWQFVLAQYVEYIGY